jgi:hypothetical protein
MDARIKSGHDERICIDLSDTPFPLHRPHSNVILRCALFARLEGCVAASGAVSFEARCSLTPQDDGEILGAWSFLSQTLRSIASAMRLEG